MVLEYILKDTGKGTKSFMISMIFKLDRKR